MPSGFSPGCLFSSESMMIKKIRSAGNYRDVCWCRVLTGCRCCSIPNKVSTKYNGVFFLSIKKSWRYWKSKNIIICIFKRIYAQYIKKKVCVCVSSLSRSGLELTILHPQPPKYTIHSCASSFWKAWLICNTRHLARKWRPFCGSVKDPTASNDLLSDYWPTPCWLG